MTTRKRATAPVPRVIAHRGASWSHPENTRVAFDAAIRQGCDGIETDVQLTADGVPVIFHDWVLRKAGLGNKRIRQLEARELARSDVGAYFDRRFRGARIPTLDQVLRRYGKKTRLLLEVKSHAKERTSGLFERTGEETARRIKSAGLTSQAMMLSFDPDVLAAARAAVRGLKTVQNVARLRSLTPGRRRLFEPLYAVSLDIRTVTPRLVAQLHDMGKPVLVYTCNSARRVRLATEAGVDGIMSDRPDWLRQQLTRA